jgi:hypothetical protein
MKIVVLTQGFVLVCRGYGAADGYIHMTNVRCIRQWGTASGLAELVRGPTKDTKLDAIIPVVSAPLHSLVFEFGVSTDAWEAHL